MNEKKKCVLILDGQMPAGILANTAAILGITLGRELPEVVGENVTDADGKAHLGIIEFPVPVLCGSPSSLRELRKKLYDGIGDGMTIVDFSDVAQTCRTYDEFRAKMRSTPETRLQYCGIAICGPVKKVNSLTGHLPLLR